MRLLKGHRFRLDLTEAQDELCARTAGVCRFVWNLALEQRSQAWTHAAVGRATKQEARGVSRGIHLLQGVEEVNGELL